MQKATEQFVFRQVAFAVSTFDYLKEFQRGYERRHGVHLTNNQAVAVILGDHQRMTEESEERVSTGRKAGT